MSTYPFAVMVVDDNDADVEMISHGLQRLASPPHRIVLRTAAEALQALYTRPELSSGTIPCVILVEVDLPLVTGLEFVACMRCEASLRRIPVFVLTDSNLDSDQLAACNLDVAGYLRKPTLPDESTAIAALLEAYVRSG